MFKHQYRVSRDICYSDYWAVQIKRWYFPVWIEHGNGGLRSKEDAYELIGTLKEIR